MKEVAKNAGSELIKMIAGTALMLGLIGALMAAILGGFAVAAYAPIPVAAKIAFATVWAFAAYAGLIRARLI